MKQLYVKVRTPNKKILVKGNLVRTPTNFIINESQLDFFKNNFAVHSIIDYEIEDYIPEDKHPIIQTKKSKPKKQNSKKKTGTVLDQFII